MSLLLLFQGARIVRGYIDTSEVTDTLRITIRRRFTDDAGASDVLRQSMTLRRSFTDDAGASDVLSRVLRRRFTDDAGASDTLRMVRNFRRSYTDDTGASDSGLLNGGPLFPGLFDLWAGADLGNDTVTVLNAPLITEGRYGNQDRDWPVAVFTTVERCSLQPLSADEVSADREFAATHMRLFAPPGTPLTAVSRIVYAGTTYEADGEPGHWRDLDGRPSHIEAVVKRLTG